MKLRAAPGGTAAVSFAIGVALFRYAHGPFRGFFGDILVILFLVACLATVGLGRPATRLAVIGVVALGTECLQLFHLVGPESHWFLHFTLGSTFDPYDFAAYAVGLGVAAVAERAWLRAEAG